MAFGGWGDYSSMGGSNGFPVIMFNQQQHISADLGMALYPDASALDEMSPPFRCRLCAIELKTRKFMKQHLEGRPHQRALEKIKMRRLKVQHQHQQQALQQEELNVSKNVTVSCKLCNISVNSIQQMEVHNAGAKHTSKLQKMGMMPRMPMAGNPFRPPQMGMIGPQMPNPNLSTAQISVQEVDCDSVNWDDLPACLVKLDSGPGYKCKTCGKSLNSRMQVVQHLTSKKHIQKESQANPGADELGPDEALPPQAKRPKPNDRFKQGPNQGPGANSWKQDQANMASTPTLQASFVKSSS